MWVNSAGVAFYWRLKAVAECFVNQRLTILYTMTLLARLGGPARFHIAVGARMYRLVLLWGAYCPPGQ
jgi:hypothetical protein